VGNGTVDELQGRFVTVEKSLQALIETHLYEPLGVRFLASEYSTGKTHGGRIDMLGIDEFVDTKGLLGSTETDQTRNV
jgi:hypothetical protein